MRNKAVGKRFYRFMPPPMRGQKQEEGQVSCVFQAGSP